MVLTAYRKTLIFIAAFNFVLVAVTHFMTQPLPSSIGTVQTEYSASASFEATKPTSCTYLETVREKLPSQSPMQLKMRAARIFELERTNPNRDFAFLTALSTALKFQSHAQVERLILQYECGRHI